MYVTKGDEGHAFERGRFSRWTQNNWKFPLHWGPEFFGAPQGEKCIDKTFAVMKWAAIFGRYSVKYYNVSSMCSAKCNLAKEGIYVPTM